MSQEEYNLRIEILTELFDLLIANDDLAGASLCSKKLYNLKCGEEFYLFDKKHVPGTPTRITYDR